MQLQDQNLQVDNLNLNLIPFPHSEPWHWPVSGKQPVSLSENDYHQHEMLQNNH